MALADGVKTVKLTINEVELEVPAGELVVESVKRLGLEIPVFCYHPRMKPVGMCRMCLIDVGFRQPDGSVRMMPKPQAGCTLPASDNMVVYTDSENVHRDRRGVLEFLLANHPLDCPICDRGGECPLQNNTLAYGPSTSRFIELKRHLPKAFPLSQYVTLDLERCIQCGRCVRFTEEISGEAELAFRFRGANMQPSTFKLMDFESKFSGNVIEICPVGALTSSKYRFRARPWDLEATEAVCTGCSNGCNVWFDHRAGRFVRINGRVNEAVNEEWTCDKGKFGHDYYNSSDRLTSPLIRKDDTLVACSWSEAYEAIAHGFARNGSVIGGLTGGRVSNEGLYLFKKLINDVLGSPNLGHRIDGNFGSSVVESSFNDFEKASSVVVFGTRLADDLPIAFLRLRKAATQAGVKVLVVTHDADEADEFASESRRIARGSEVEAASKLNLDSGTIVLTTHRLFESESGRKALEVLKSACRSSGAAFNSWALNANDYGAELIGVVPSGEGLGEKGLLDSSLEALWVVECDPASTNRGHSALESAEFVVYQGTLVNETMAYASVVLPMAAPSEQEGTWTNCEGRVQAMRQAIAAPGDSKPAWRIFSEAILRLKPATPFFNPKEVFADLCREVDAFKSLSGNEIPDEGALLPRQRDKAMVGESNPTGG